MSLPELQGFTKSLAMTVLSEVGDRTFCVAAILAMRYPRKSVLFGCLSSVIVMTILSALVGWAAPNLISRKWAHYITTFLFFGFGLWSLWEAFMEDDDDNEELEQVEKELAADSKGKAKTGGKADDDLKKQSRPFLTRFFSPVFLKAFSVTFFGEWGDKSQLATIGLAADEDTLAVILGGIIGQTLCTIAAVIGGKSLASRISERLVTLLEMASCKYYCGFHHVYFQLFSTTGILTANLGNCIKGRGWGCHDRRGDVHELPQTVASDMHAQHDNEIDYYDQFEEPDEIFSTYNDDPFSPFATRMMTRMGYQAGSGLGRELQGMCTIPYLFKNEHTFGLGYRPTDQDYYRKTRMARAKREATAAGDTEFVPIDMMPYANSLNGYFVKAGENLPYFGFPQSVLDWITPTGWEIPEDDGACECNEDVPSAFHADVADWNDELEIDYLSIRFEDMKIADEENWYDNLKKDWVDNLNKDCLSILFQEKKFEDCFTVYAR
ncbi:hypothetical protein F0562_005261 [Nyssa sinensis]|uniref:G-patch domain-containing protein n=1 Tax=Nyssa sinensis TaxID=561372 RepID=A0A5J5AL64_9ASTE|nr:hypothetical protein F0562_005261 [Nyssa sinensis]